MTSTHAVERGEAPVHGQARRPCRHARSAGLRLPADRAGRGDQDRSLRHGRPQALPLHRALGRGARHRRRRGPRDRQPASTGRRPRRSGRRCRRYIGTIQQVPPRYSAIKIEGERAYDLARDGEDGGTGSPAGGDPPAELVEVPDADHAVLEAECGKGTYVRSWPAIWAGFSAASAMFAPCAGPPSGRLAKKDHDFAGTTGGTMP